MILVDIIDISSLAPIHNGHCNSLLDSVLQAIDPTEIQLTNNLIVWEEKGQNIREQLFCFLLVWPYFDMHNILHHSTEVQMFLHPKKWVMGIFRDVAFSPMQCSCASKIKRQGGNIRALTRFWILLLNLPCTSDCAVAKKTESPRFINSFSKTPVPAAITPTTPHLDWTGHGTFSLISSIKVRMESSKERKVFERKIRLVDDWKLRIWS